MILSEHLLRTKQSFKYQIIFPQYYKQSTTIVVVDVTVAIVVDYDFVLVIVVVDDDYEDVAFVVIFIMMIL